MNGDRIKAQRHAREIVYDLHWLGMIVPALYVRMADEFQVSFAAATTRSGWRPTGRTRDVPALMALCRLACLPTRTS